VKLNVLQSVALIVIVEIGLAILLAGCAPTPFVTGREISTPAGCAEARERGHEC